MGLLQLRVFPAGLLPPFSPLRHDVRPSPVTNECGDRGGTLGGETPGEGVGGCRPSAQIESTLAANVPSKFTS